MKLMSVALLLAASPAFGGQGATLAPIALYAQFEQKPPADVLSAMQTELASIMAPMGLRFSWRDLSAARSSEVSVELAVVTFKGACDASHLSVRGFHATALGWTHVSDGTILPFADIDCEGVRAFLQSGLMSTRGSQRDELYGRALGRVLAHELYHIFANTPHHGAGGVGKAAYTVDNLLEDDFQFGEKESTALIMSKAHEILSAAGEDSSR